MLIVGLAPEQQGANRTGSPFAGGPDAMQLRAALVDAGFAELTKDGLQPRNCRIVHAVRCAAPASLPQPVEVRSCNSFLRSELQTMPSLKMVLSLGVLAHNAVVAACGVPLSRIRFRHGQIITMPDGLRLADSHHLSHQSRNAGQVTAPTFLEVIRAVRAEIPGGARIIAA